MNVTSRRQRDANRGLPGLPDDYHGTIKAVASYPGCGGLTPYMYGAALAHLQVFDVVAYHGQSGGAIAAAMAASRAPIDAVLAMNEAWNPSKVLRKTDSKGMWAYVDIRGRGDAAGLEAFLDEQFTKLGFPTFGEFRYREGQRPDGIDFDHALQFGLSYIDIPASRAAKFLKDPPTFFNTLWHARGFLPRHIKNMVFPRDVEFLLPHLAKTIDQERISRWSVNSSRHPAQYETYWEELNPSGALRVVFDGDVFCRQPYLFSPSAKPPLPQITYRPDLNVTPELRAKDLSMAPGVLINRGIPPCASFDLEGLARYKNELVTMGYRDCAEDLEETLVPYLESMLEGAPLRSPADLGIELKPSASPLVLAANRRIAALGVAANSVKAGTNLVVQRGQSWARTYGPTRAGVSLSSATESLGRSVEVGVPAP